MAPEDRPKVGQLVNGGEREDRGSPGGKQVPPRWRRLSWEKKLAEEVIDVTLPAKKADVGHRHPNTIALGRGGADLYRHGLRGSGTAGK